MGKTREQKAEEKRIKDNKKALNQKRGRQTLANQKKAAKTEDSTYPRDFRTDKKKL